MRILLLIWALISGIVAIDALGKSEWAMAVVFLAVFALLVWAIRARTRYWRRQDRT